MACSEGVKNKQITGPEMSINGPRRSVPPLTSLPPCRCLHQSVQSNICGGEQWDCLHTGRTCTGGVRAPPPCLYPEMFSFLSSWKSGNFQPGLRGAEVLTLQCPEAEDSELTASWSGPAVSAHEGFQADISWVTCRLVMVGL